MAEGATQGVALRQLLDAEVAVGESEINRAVRHMLFTSFSQVSCGQERGPIGPRGSGLPGPDPNPADGVVCGTLWRGMQFWVRLAGGGPSALAGGGPG